MHQPKTENDILAWIKRHRALAGITYIFAILLFFEGSLQILARYGLITVKHFPTTSQQTSFLGDIDPDFGVWHYPNRSVEHTSPCFNVVYDTNSYGARDRQRAFENDNDKDPRVVVLGDSFIEGFGVEENERMTDIAEKKTKSEYLNFGVSGNFGSIQQWLLYDKLASKFEHSHLVISLLPANDFSDNDPANFPEKRFRPYLRRKGDGDFEIYFRTSFADRMQPMVMKPGRVFRRKIYNQIYTANLIRQFGDYLENSKLSDEYKDITAEILPSFYDSYRPQDLEILLYSYKKTIERAGNRPTVIMVIPRLLDLQEIQEKGYHFRLISELNAFAAKFPAVKILDLAPYFIDYAKKKDLPLHDFFHTCDGHWSRLGNQIAAEALTSSISPAIASAKLM